MAIRRPRASTKVRHRRRRRGLWALGIVIVLLLGSGVGTVVAYTTVKSRANQLQAQLAAHLSTAQSELEAAKSNLKDANSTHDEKLITSANTHFASAKAEFTAARSIADNSRLLHDLESLPSVGGIAKSRHVAVDGIADMGVALTDAGVELAKLDGQLIKPASSGGQQGRTLLTVLDQTNTSLVAVRADLDKAQKAAARVDVHVLSAAQQVTFAKARATITTAVAAADEFQRLVPIITEILGGNGTRTYLIEQVNPSELRPGGGFLGTYSVMQADHGTLKLIKSGPAEDLIGTRAAAGQPGYIAPPGPIREFIPNTSWSYVDSNFFPDFTSNAAAAERFAQPFLGLKIDAVISIDYYAVAKMLEVTGPLPVPGYSITVNATNFVPIVVEHDNADDNAHKAILSVVASTLVARLAALPAGQWPALITALNQLSTTRHLQAYFNNADVQKQMDQFGWSGGLNPTGAKDYMMEVEANLGGTKANYYVVRHYTVELTRSGSTLHHKVTIDLTDNMPFSYRPREYYRAYLRLYVSDNATSTSDNLRPVVYPNPAPPAGTKMIDGWVPLFHGYGHSAQAVFSYDTPWIANGRGEGQIYWQKQPGLVGDAITVKWNDGSGHAYTVSGDLAQDRVVIFSSKGISIAAGEAAQAHLPSLSFG